MEYASYILRVSIAPRIPERDRRGATRARARHYDQETEKRKRETERDAGAVGSEVRRPGRRGPAKPGG